MKKLAKKQDGGDSTKTTGSYIKKDLKKAMQDSAAARKYIKTNKGNWMDYGVVEKKLKAMHKPYEIRKAANDSAGVKTPPYKDISKGSYWNKKTGGAIKTKSKK